MQAKIPTPMLFPPLCFFKTRELTEHYERREFDALSDKFLTVLQYFRTRPMQAIDERMQRALNDFVPTFLQLFTKADFPLASRLGLKFVRHNPTVANLTALTPLGTTDAFLDIVLQQRENLPKTLTLYSARNSLRLDPRVFFDSDPWMASAWYHVFTSIFHSGLVRSEIAERLQEHLSYQDPRLELTRDISYPYFGSSYVPGGCDRVIKPLLNRSVRRAMAGLHIRNRPNPNKIAVVTSLWRPAHSSYRTNSPYVKSLTGYHLTLITEAGAKAQDTSLFQDVKEVEFSGSDPDLSSICDNDFQLVYFPDMGMTPFSIRLGNLRLAPVSVTSTGHSVSSWGSEIDYYFSGADVEVPERPEQNYSERLVLLPGAGAVHSRPQYQPTGRSKKVSAFVLNCPWTAFKVNHLFLRVLQELVRRSQKTLRFRLFAAGSLNQHLDHILFARDVASILAPAEVEVLAEMPYPDYMQAMEEGDLTIDSFYFGGCNTAADSLFLRKLMVMWQGDKWYNRIGSQMATAVGLPELIATSEQEYLAIALKLIHDDRYRAELQERLCKADLDATIFSRADATYFRKAIDFLIANNERLKEEKDRSPIRIERDERIHPHSDGHQAAGTFPREKAATSKISAALTRYLSGPGPFKLELGAGTNAKPGWFATDLSARQSPNGETTLALDATQPFDIPADCFDFIYCEHMIEHVPFSSGQRMLRECHRVLKPGGRLRIVTPSLGFLLRIMSPDRSRLERSYLAWSVTQFVPNAPKITNAFFLNNFVRAWGHVFIYDHETLHLAMTLASFTNITECRIGLSEHEALRGLENEVRLPPGFLELESMILEGSKE
jgi:predicted SAM-dependent methyltransferase